MNKEENIKTLIIELDYLYIKEKLPQIFSYTKIKMLQRASFFVPKMLNFTKKIMYDY